MPELDPKIAELEARLDSLVRTQIDFQQEITTIRRELTKLRGDVRAGTPANTLPPAITNKLPGDVSISDTERPTTPNTADAPSISATPEKEPVRRPEAESQREAAYVPPPAFGTGSEQPNGQRTSNAFSDLVSSYTESARGDLEKFIGENLISKIGIVILVLGVGIGAKYAIDNGWISPLLRIVFGYVMGFGLLGFAARLKEKYLNFSSVLLSGGMAIMYFVTYFAYAYYSLIPLLLAFILMAMFTVFTVAAALFYNRQVIAHIGLVGGYAVPFLLSNNSGNYAALFTYMAILNAGILAISVKKFWKPLFYTSSGFTWLIFATWVGTKYNWTEHLYLALIFLAVFFGLFYAAKVVQGIRDPSGEDSENLVSTVITAVIFYTFLFTIGNIPAGSYEYSICFSFLGAASLAILVTSFRFYGRVLIFVAGPFTWLIYGSWFWSRYNTVEHFTLAAIFAAVFFAIFYGATLVYGLRTDEIGMVENAGLVLTNSFVFYGFGYAILDSRENLQPYEGLFTAAHGLFHSGIAHLVNRLKPKAVDIVQVLAILIITFATIAVPVQFDGKVVTLVWSVEAAALFWFGRERLIPLFEYISYPVMALACSSLAADWIIIYLQRMGQPQLYHRAPIANGEFVAASIFVVASAFIFRVNRKKLEDAAIGVQRAGLYRIVVGSVGLLALYNMFRMEIGNYYHPLIVAAGSSQSLVTPRGLELSALKHVWELDYTMFFLSVVGVINVRRGRSSILAFAGVAFSGLALFLFVARGTRIFYGLGISYGMDASETGFMYIAIRYISYLFAAFLLGSLFVYSRDELLTAKFPKGRLVVGFDAVLYTTIFVTASYELLNLMGQFYIPDSTKLGLSILWGVYALTLIVIGIAKNKRHLRIAAIALLGVTLAKLFLYDVADLPTIPKTILFISLGLLMLIVSFLYNKYKGLIFKAGADEEGKSVEFDRMS